MSGPRKAFDHGSLIYDEGGVTPTNSSIAFNHHSPSNSLLPPRPKRLFSSRGSPLVEPNSYNNGEDDETRSLSGDEARSEKRSRTSDWPLKSSGQDNNERDRVPLRRLSNGSDSPSKQQRRAAVRPRPSKFLEGSMNDRVSTQPQARLIDEELREEYDDEQGGVHVKRHRAHPSSSANYGPPLGDMTSLADKFEKSDNPRHSVIFRFGKSLASTFNPTNWKIWSKPQTVEETAIEKTLRERQEKAEIAYEEMKKTGQFRYTMDWHEKASDAPKVQGSKRHSAIQLDQRASADSGDIFGSLKIAGISKKEKRYGRVFAAGPEFDSTSRPQGLVSEAPPPTLAESPITFNRFNVNAKRTQAKEAQPSAADDLPAGTHMARRVPSRKDLQKERELIKKVSDLEGRLEAARRQLSKARGEQAPEPAWTGRRPFVPGALPTLLSERLLSGFTDSGEALPTVESVSDIGKAITTADQSSVVVPQQIKARPESHNPAKAHFKTEASRVAHKSLPVLPDMSAWGTEPKSSKVENQLWDPNSSNASWNAEERDTQHELHTKPSKTLSKKRKSIGLNFPDDGGIYKPSTESSCDEYDILPRKRVSGTPKKAAGTPQKISKHKPMKRSSTSEVMDENKTAPSSIEVAVGPAAGKRVTVAKGKASVWAKVHGKAVVSPPATSSTHISAKMAIVKEDDRDDQDDKEHVPQSPLPSKKPSKLHLASPETTQGPTSGSPAAGKVTEMVEKRKTIKKVDAEFEWPSDVF